MAETLLQHATGWARCTTLPWPLPMMTSSSSSGRSLSLEGSLLPRCWTGSISARSTSASREGSSMRQLRSRPDLPWTSRWLHWDRRSNCLRGKKKTARQSTTVSLSLSQLSVDSERRLVGIAFQHEDGSAGDGQGLPLHYRLLRKPARVMPGNSLVHH